MNYFTLRNIKRTEYEHPSDIQGRKGLKTIPGLDMLTKKVSELALDRFQILELKGSFLEVNQNQYPKLFRIFSECCNILDIEQPSLFLEENFQINAAAQCPSQPCITINTGTIEALTDDELRFIIGHELGHIKSEHLEYKFISVLLKESSGYIAEMFEKIAPLMGGIKSALTLWERAAEYTADRAGLLACQDINVASSALAKMAGYIRDTDDQFSPQEFLNQAQRFKEMDSNLLDGLAKQLEKFLGSRSHPWTVLRAAELNNWFNSDYDKIINLYGRKSVGGNSSSTLRLTDGDNTSGKLVIDMGSKK